MLIVADFVRAISLPFLSNSFTVAFRGVSGVLAKATTGCTLMEDTPAMATMVARDRMARIKIYLQGL